MADSIENERLADAAAEAGIDEYSQGNLDAAIAHMRRATVLYSAADTAACAESPGRIEARARAYRLCGDYLIEREEFAEAANLMQHAVDHYSRLDSEEAEEIARRCAQRVLLCISGLRARPYERLHLLIAQYEHRRDQYAAIGGHEREQANCEAHIAKILLRRDRYSESLQRYLEALRLYASAGDSPDVMLARAECHHRMAGLLAYRLKDAEGARKHYREAITIYAEHESPVYGVQESKKMCERALEELD